MLNENDTVFQTEAGALALRRDGQTDPIGLWETDADPVEMSQQAMHVLRAPALLTLDGCASRVAVGCVRLMQ